MKWQHFEFSAKQRSNITLENREKIQAVNINWVKYREINGMRKMSGS